MKIVTGTQMQALDRRTILEARVPSLILMERAGTGLADFIQSRFGPASREARHCSLREGQQRR